MRKELIGVASVFTAVLFLGGCDDDLNAKKPEKVEIDKAYWVCTSTYISRHPKREGMLTRFGRMSDSPEYNSVECNQWPAKMVSGGLGGDAVKAKDADKVR